MPRRIPIIDFARMRSSVLKKKEELRLRSEHLAKSRKNLQNQIDELSRIRFLKRRALEKALSEAHRKATVSNMDARIQAALQTFENECNTAITAYETALNNLRNAIVTGQPKNVIAQREHEFSTAEQNYENTVAAEEKRIKAELEQIRKGYTNV